MGRASAISLTVLALLCCARTAAHAQDADWSDIQKGLYLTRAGDCAACHSVPGQPAFSGGYGLKTPFGTIYSANLTPDSATGLGSWDKDDFYRAMHEGISKDKGHLYPGFPYTHFTHVTRADSDAIFTYLKTLDPVRYRPPPPDLYWPLQWRALMRGWNLVNFEAKAFKPEPGKPPAFNRGKYLVEGLMHCGMCHSPKSILGAEEGGDSRFTGGMAEGWYAPSLRGGAHEGIGHWTKEDLVSFLKAGRNGRSNAFGPMADVIQHSTRHMTDADLEAVATYVKGLPAEADRAGAGTDDLPADTKKLGGLVYATQCSACHAPDGKGVPGMLPPLAASSFVQADNPHSVIKLILEGGQTVTTQKFPTPHTMPAFSWKLTDKEVAAVATYVRNSFGNRAPAVSADQVSDLRSEAGRGG